jgi:hypothetical protein
MIVRELIEMLSGLNPDAEIRYGDQINETSRTIETIEDHGSSGYEIW